MFKKREFRNPEYPFKSHYYQTAVGRMHYVDEGQGPVVIMLHGNPTWSFYYRHLISGLRQNYRCIVPDHLGMGLSDKPRRGFEYCLSNHIKNLTALVEHLKIKSFHLIVHDWGGPMGIALAEQWPDRAQKMVILNTAAFRSTRMPSSIATCRIPYLGAFLVRGFNVFARAAIKCAVMKPMPAVAKAGYLWPYNSWRNRIGIYRFVQDIAMYPSHPSYETLVEIETALRRLRKHEFLMCWGLRDFCFNQQFLDEWRVRFPSAKVRQFPEAGHYLLEDAGEEVLSAVREFLTTDNTDLHSKKIYESKHT